MQVQRAGSRWRLGALLLGLALCVGCAGASAQTGRASIETGIASWYGPGYQGRTTASGERFNMRDRTAAHRTLPFGTRVRVTRTDTGKSVVVRINDRGPFVDGRIIDLSRRAARDLDMIDAGIAPVEVRVLRR